MNVFIEDLNKRHNGESETELPKETTIRFEIGDTKLSCTLDDDGLRVYKVNKNGMQESRIMTMGQSSNVVYIK